MGGEVTWNQIFEAEASFDALDEQTQLVTGIVGCDGRTRIGEVKIPLPTKLTTFAE
jgi:hypothetical protein